MARGRRNPQGISTDYVDPEGYGVDPSPDMENVVRPTRPQTTVLPYRGMEYHGVDPNLAGNPPDINCDVFDQTMVVPTPQESAEVEIRPVPVRVVKNDDDWETRNFRTVQHVVAAAPTRIVGRMLTRTNLIIKNDSAAGTGIWISDNPTPSLVNSFLLAPGGQLTVTAVGAVYAAASDATTYPVSVFMEFTVASRKEAEA